MNEHSIKHDIAKFAEDVYRSVLHDRENILKAFIAETGLAPSEVEQVEQIMNDGSVVWSLQKKRDCV